MIPAMTPLIKHSPFFNLTMQWGEHKRCHKCTEYLEPLPNSDHKFYCPKCKKARVFPKGTLFFEKCDYYETFNGVWVDYKRFWFTTFNHNITVYYGPDSSLTINTMEIARGHLDTLEDTLHEAVVDAMVELYGDERLREKLTL